MVLAADHMPMHANVKARTAAAGARRARAGAVERIILLASEPRLAIPGHDPAVFAKLSKVADRIVRIA